MPPGYLNAVLEIIPEGGDPSVWQPMVSGPMTGEAGSLRFVLPYNGTSLFVRVALSTNLTVPAAPFGGLDHMSAAYSDGGFYLPDSSKATHVLNRLGYGPSPADRATIDSLGIESYINTQLTPGTIDESGNARLNDEVDALFYEFLPLAGNALIAPGDTCRFFRGTSEPPFDWKDPGFDDDDWETGPTGLGYGDGDDATELTDMPFIQDVQPGYYSVYLRQTFQVDDPSAVENLILRMRYDDGFVAYLNGIPIARENVTGTPPLFNTSADRAAGNVDDSSNQFEWNLNVFKADLVASPGVNVLAVQTHNTSLTSSDFSVIPSLVDASSPAYPAIRGVRELQNLIHLRGVYSQRQLQAVLGEFWENHFTTDFDKVEDYLRDLPAYEALATMDENAADLLAETEAASLEYREYQFFYDNALGNFGDLLLYSATSPTMLIYLDSVLNLKDAPNENYPREILELHSHGVDNDYTQFDIEELARCFTGWTIRKVKPADLLPFPQSALTPPTTASISVESEVEIIGVGDNWDYFPGTVEPTPDGGGEATTDWTQPDYIPVSGWLNGPSGFGYGDSDDTTILSDMPFEEGVNPGYLSCYIRTEFTVSTGAYDTIALELDYDDGFVAYLNGTEIARSNTLNDAGSPPAFDTPSGSHEAGNPVLIDLTPFASLLNEAPLTNVIAIQGHNTGLTSSDFSLIPRIVLQNYSADSIGEADPEGIWTFRFDPDEHDTGAKVIFDAAPYQLDIPAGRVGAAGVNDAIDVINAIVDVPPTAEFICLKLVNRFVSDEITLESYQNSLAPSWLLTVMDEAIIAWNSTTPKGNIATVMTAILDPANQTSGFWLEAAEASKIKNPVEFINSGFRALDAEITSNNLARRADGMGMKLFQRDEPDGFSELGAAWTDTLGLLERMKLAQALGLNSSYSYSNWDIDATLAANSITTAEGLIDHFDHLLFNDRLLPQRRSVLLRFANTDASGALSEFSTLSSSAKTRRLRELTGLILATPEFQYQ